MSSKSDRLILGVAAAVSLVVIVAAAAQISSGDPSDVTPNAVAAETAVAAENRETAVVTGPVDDDCSLTVRSATLALRSAAFDRLIDAGTEVEAIAPAGDLGQGAAALDLKAPDGFDCRLSQGTLAAAGGLRFLVGGKAVEITDLSLDLDAGTVTADVVSPDFDGRVDRRVGTSEIRGLDRGSEVVYVLPVSLLNNDPGTLQDALQKAAMSPGDLASDSLLTLIAARN